MDETKNLQDKLLDTPENQGGAKAISRLTKRITKLQSKMENNSLDETGFEEQFGKIENEVVKVCLFINRNSTRV